MLSRNVTASEMCWKNDPWFWINVIARIICLYFAGVLGHWVNGDTGHYLLDAQNICKGAWGGEPFRVPFYDWFLAASSLCQVYRYGEVAQGGGVFLPLIIQNVIVLALGIFLYKKFGRKFALIWIFDPVVFLYSHIIMTDILFSCELLLYFYFVKKIFYDHSTSSRDSVWMGLFLGIAVLTRPIAMPLGLVSLLFLIFKLSDVKKRKVLVISILVFFAVLVPRLVWNYHESNEIFLSKQGDEWIKQAAAVVEYDGQGLSFSETEAKWYKEKPYSTPTDAILVFFKKFPTAVVLCLKSLARVLIGHLNVETYYLFSGTTLIGPGWFKVPEGGETLPLRSGLLFWSMGVILFAIYYLKLYFDFFKLLFKQGLRIFKQYYYSYSFFSLIFLAVIPLVFGNARFRLAFWPIFILIWATLEKHKQETN